MELSNRTISVARVPLCARFGMARNAVATSISAHTGRLVYCACLLLVMLVGYNMLISFLARHSQRHLLLEKLSAVSASTDVVFVGNSLVEAGCDMDSFRASWTGSQKPTPINLALGGTSPVEHALILKHALSPSVHPKYVLYGFFDDQLASTTTGRFDELVGNRAFSYYYPAEAAEYYAPGSRYQSLLMQVIAHVPMVAERSTIWSKVELLRRSLSGVGMPQKAVNRYGRVDDFSALEAHDLAGFTSRCQAILAKGGGFSRPVRSMIEVAKAHGATPVFIEMPLPSHHRELFYSSDIWRKARARFQELAAEEKVVYVSASGWVPDDSAFEDATHLSPRGAAVFSALLARELSGRTSAAGL